MNLSRNFTLSELIKSDTAIRKGINNNPNAEQIEKLKDLCENILQPVRDHYGRVKVTSGFRSSELCVAIGSSVNSQHAKAEAADFECIGVDNAELADWIYKNLDFDQLILEFYTPGEPNSGWIHCSYVPEGGRKQLAAALAEHPERMMFKNIAFCQDHISSYSGRISPRRQTLLRSQEQKKLTIAVKLNRYLGLLPYCDKHS